MPDRDPSGGAPEQLRVWVETVAKDLVDNASAVEVAVVEEDGVSVFELVVDPDELGRVIGRQGRTAQALRTLLGVAGARHGRSYDLEILE
ncbi:MAG TPA: KH domain-containing protein [Candidatus Polarisedimenticolia bacterium]|nr:KH domain-containing protein [Candidatus Polarisedimenticolia bacterium]